MCRWDLLWCKYFDRLLAKEVNMSSGNSLLAFSPLAATPPSSNPATYELRNDHVVLAFDAATPESIYLEAVMPQAYAAGGLTCVIAWMAGAATSGNVVLGLSIERHQDETDDLDSDSFAAEQTVTAAAPATNGAVQYSTITFTDGAQMDSVSTGEHFRFKLRRVADNGSDTMTGDLHWLSMAVRET
jgi:hypothetical protein